MGLDLIAPYECSQVPPAGRRSGLRWLPLRDATHLGIDALLDAYEPHFAPMAVSL